MPIVQRPLAAVLARGDGPVRRPRDLADHTVGVTGLPSDEAVVDSEVSADGGDPSAVKRVTIGFNAVASLAAGKVDAATGFWNDEAVELRRQGVPLRVFKLDRYGAPPYPELVLTTTAKELREDPHLVAAMMESTRRGYRFAEQQPETALDDLIAAEPNLERGDARAQLDGLLPVLEPKPFDPRVLREWSTWAADHGLLEKPLPVGEAFDLLPR